MLELAVETHDCCLAICAHLSSPVTKRTNRLVNEKCRNLGAQLLELGQVIAEPSRERILDHGGGDDLHGRRGKATSALVPGLLALHDHPAYLHLASRRLDRAEPTNCDIFSPMLAPSISPLDRHLPVEIRSMLEERLCRPVGDGLTVEELLDDDLLVSSPEAHPALFSDHGIVHVRDVATGLVDLAATTDGVLLPLRPDERQDFVVGLGVLLTYIHDAGMHDSTPEGRRVHALHAAHVPFSGAIDDVLDLLMRDGGPVVRRIAAVNDTAPFAAPADVVLRELISLAVGHSKSAVPSALLGDRTALRRLMQIVVLSEPDLHRGGDVLPTANGQLPGELGANARWYSDARQEAFAWLDSSKPAHRAFAEDAIDATRLVRAADALRQRGTTLRTTAGYEIFIDGETGAAVFALRTKGADRLLLLRLDSPLSAGEANLKAAFVTPSGDLRIVFHRGRFSSPLAAAAASDATARVAADVAADVLGAFATRSPSSDLPEPNRDPRAMRVELERPRDGPSFAEEVAEALARRDPSLTQRVAVVAEPGQAIQEGLSSAERSRYEGGIAVRGDSAEVPSILRELGARGVKVEAIDSLRAFEGVRRVHLDPDDVLVEAGSPSPFIYVGLDAGLKAHSLGGYGAADIPAWLPIGITGVVRGAERNSTIVAVAPVDVLAIPGELFIREWFHPYESTEISEMLAKVGGE